MGLNDYPFSCITEGTRFVFGGVLAFFFGLAGGSLIVFSRKIAELRFEWTAVLLAWMGLLPFTVAKLWGLLLLPFLGAMLFGMVWREWNRLIGASLTAIALSVAVLVSARHNPFESCASALPFSIAMGIALLGLLTGIITEFRPRARPPKPEPPA